eukprot:6175928-Pleurochrysis_carterae.AAC.2
MGTVRHWKQHFTLPRERDRQLACKEWEERLWSLSVNMPVDNLEAHQKPQWPAFPTRQATAHAVLYRHQLSGLSDYLSQPFATRTG